MPRSRKSEKQLRDELCQRIVSCQTARKILYQPGASLEKADLACASIVLSQLNADGCSNVVADNVPGAIGLNAARWLLPEPWNGKLDTAKLLFIGQNPSADFKEDYPTLGVLPKPTVLDFFESRFEAIGYEKASILDGVKVKLQKAFHRDGDPYSGPNPFLQYVRVLAEILCGTDVKAGEDYALTESVRCKSRNAIGVHLAVDACAKAFMDETISRSGARVIICIGALARRAFLIPLCRNQKDLDEQIKLYAFGSMATIRNGQDASRRVVFLKHSNARSVKGERKPILEMASELRAVLAPIDSPILPWNFSKSSLEFFGRWT